MTVQSINQSIIPLHRVRHKISGTNLYTGVNRRSTVKMVEAVFFQKCVDNKGLRFTPLVFKPNLCKCLHYETLKFKTNGLNVLHLTVLTNLDGISIVLPFQLNLFTFILPP